MTIIIGWAHVGFKYFSFILGMGFPVLSEHPVRHGLPVGGVPCPDDIKTMYCSRFFVQRGWAEGRKWVKARAYDADGRKTVDSPA